MQEQLSKIVKKLCQELPFDLTLYEQKGGCKNPSDDCKFCKSANPKTYFCIKKTYTPDMKYKTT